MTSHYFKNSLLVPPAPSVCPGARRAPTTNCRPTQGVNANLVAPHGYGETNPIASNETPDGRSKNRRFELTLTPE
jgi:hypothetical protein